MRFDTSAGPFHREPVGKALKDFEFPLPPIEEQKRIAEILWAADEAINTYKATLHHLSQVFSLVMKKTLGKEYNAKFSDVVRLASWRKQRKKNSSLNFPKKIQFLFTEETES